MPIGKIYIGCPRGVTGAQLRAPLDAVVL